LRLTEDILVSPPYSSMEYIYTLYISVVVEAHDMRDCATC
jgi:hypothetical protein